MRTAICGDDTGVPPSAMRPAASRPRRIGSKPRIRVEGPGNADLEYERAPIAGEVVGHRVQTRLHRVRHVGVRPRGRTGQKMAEGESAWIARKVLMRRANFPRLFSCLQSK